MIRRSLRITSVFLASALVFTGVHFDSLAATSASVLPSGGVAFTLAEGKDLGNLAGNYKPKTEIQTVVKPEDLPQLDILSEEEAEEELFKNLVIAQVSRYVNVRSIPSEKGEILGKLYDDSVGTFLAEEDGWYKIQSGSVTGYVKSEFCVTGDEAAELAKKLGVRIAKVTARTLKVRTEPSLTAEVLGYVPLDDELVVKEETDGWVKVDIEEGIGWVSRDFVTLRSEFVQAESKEEEAARLEKEAEERRKAREAAEAEAAKKKANENKNSTSAPTVTATVSGEGSEMGKAVAEYALQFVGNPYVYGGTSLTNGADCSGFVMSVYANFGVTLPHSSAADRNQGYAVEGGIDNAQPGDLICYSGHVALYIGDGKIVHASTEKTGIIVSSAYYKQALAVRRIF